MPNNKNKKFKQRKIFMKILKRISQKVSGIH